MKEWSRKASTRPFTTARSTTEYSSFGKPMLMKEDLDSTWQASATFRSAASLCQIGTSVMKINGRSSEGWQNKKNLTTSWWHPSVVCGPPCRTSTTRRQREKRSWRTYEPWRSTTTCSSTRTSTMMESASAMTPLWSSRPMGCHGRRRHWNQ